MTGTMVLIGTSRFITGGTSRELLTPGLSEANIFISDFIVVIIDNNKGFIFRPLKLKHVKHFQQNCYFRDCSYLSA